MSCADKNQNWEEIARDAIDAQLRLSGWKVQHKTSINLHAGQMDTVIDELNQALSA